MQYLPHSSRRNVVIDIETVATNSDDSTGALSALTGRIVCIGLLFDDGETVTELALIDQDEGQMLRSFWQTVRPTDVFIGHNVLQFDLPFIRQRSWILGVRPSRKLDLRRFYTADVIDTVQFWSGWGATKQPSLNAIGGALGCRTKAAEGCQVSEWWAAGDLASIAGYCLADIRLICLVFLRMTYQQVPLRLVGRLSIPPALGAERCTVGTAT